MELGAAAPLLVAVVIPRIRMISVVTISVVCVRDVAVSGVLSNHHFQGIAHHSNRLTVQHIEEHLPVMQGKQTGFRLSR
ncbi:hypothetical protein D3C76_1720950 [compost metagenome]